MLCIIPLIDSLFAITAAVTKNICCVAQSIEQTVLVIKLCVRRLCDLFFPITLVDPQILDVQTVRAYGMVFFILIGFMADQA